MRAYLTPIGRDTLLRAYNNIIAPVKLTGLQIGSRFGFVADSTMLQAEGSILVNARNNPNQVHVTPRHLHEMIFTARIPRDLEFSTMGNVVFFANDVPLIWSVSDKGMPKQKTDGIAHFAGDEYFLPVIFRFPYLQKLLDLSTNTSLAAKFPQFASVQEMNVPEHVAADQVHLDTGPHFFRKRPVTVFRTHQYGWMANPTGFALQDKQYKIDGGKPRSGI